MTWNGKELKIGDQVKIKKDCYLFNVNVDKEKVYTVSETFCSGLFGWCAHLKGYMSGYKFDWLEKVQ